ncbi:hypothetical protein GK047_12675 [Paenibacillus sp. SYP-B3998]|uniref:Uncharacterized protein n=1 Tax=Paenibacillus sp. SYP-B3998 TaxID=2678564 RepID=A0A6G3ZXP7_9BACL|nr:hypothetical protein [Paenibacillus sp. SYP-B3998]NEW06860.1 hypothetical protein [Paenibacillus sp. SYP-B3998]
MSTKNNWNVPYSSIVWFFNVIKNHTKVLNVVREHDILFTVTDDEDKTYKILLLDEYRMGSAAVLKVIEEFGHIDFKVFGGNWNAATNEAYKVAKENEIALFDYSGILGALNLKNPKGYKQNEKKKNTTKSRNGA